MNKQDYVRDAADRIIATSTRGKPLGTGLSAYIENDALTLAENYHELFSDEPVTPELLQTIGFTTFDTLPAETYLSIELGPNLVLAWVKARPEWGRFSLSSQRASVDIRNLKTMGEVRQLVNLLKQG